MNNSKVSIIIPTYKRGERVTRAIESALNQDYNNFEVIVVDDNDPETIERLDTEKAVEKYLDLHNFKYIKHDKNRNGSAARNTGIRNSLGDYITFLDDDDEYFPGKIREQVKAMETLSDEWGICYSRYKKIDRYGRIQLSSETAEGNVLVQALTKNLFVGSGSNFMVKKDIAIELKGFDETFQRNQDLEFMVRVVSKYKMKFVNHVGILIHNEIRENKFSFLELIEINNEYRKKFSYQINNLKLKEKEEVLKTLDLWDVRAAITERKFGEIVKIVQASSLKKTDLLKFIKYLIGRSITKKSYGFKL